MKIAIPTADGKLCSHFGHCETFTVVTVEDGAVKTTEALKPPPHEPGVLPRWLKQLGVNVVIAGGMGPSAQQFLSQFGIQVVVGAQPDDPANIVRAFLDGSLVSGENVCDH